MDFNNLILRIFTSFFLISLFFIIIYFFELYLPFAIFIVYMIILYEIFLFFKIKKQRPLILILYVFFSLISIQLYFAYFYERTLFLYFVLLIICFDTTSYISGSLFGKKKIIPNISPNKTFLGFFSGLTLTLIISLIFNNFLQILTLLNSFIFSILIISLSFAGDIIESVYKRKFNIKNSSNFLPGHGGIFDRLDGFVMGSIAILIFSYFV